MKINFKIKNKTLIVSFNGELDHHIADEIRKKIDNHFIQHSLRNIILDLKDLNFMDSAGIGLIMGRYNLVAQSDGKIYLIHVASRVSKMISMSGVLKIAHICNDLEEALDNL